MKRTLTALAVLIALTASAYGAYRITLDPGGQIDQYHQRYTMLRDAGAKIEIDGLCIFACTMILGLIPPENVCVTERARLAFHSASNAFGQPASEGTRLLWAIYPPKVREYLKQRGWNGDDKEKNEHPDLIYMELPELEQFYKRCRVD